MNESLHDHRSQRHPSASALAEFASGRLDEAQLDEIEAHLGQCPACCRSLKDLSHEQDRFVSELISAANVSASGLGIRVSSTQSDADAVLLLPEKRVHSAVFSPDGKRFVVDTRTELVFFNIGSWDISHRTRWERHGVASNYRIGLSFTTDGGLLAVSRPTYEIKLVDPATGRVLATLPSDVPAANVCFPGGGDHLLCSGTDLTVQAWDLALVRKQLAAVGLDW